MKNEELSQQFLEARKQRQLAQLIDLNKQHDFVNTLVAIDINFDFIPRNKANKIQLSWADFSNFFLKHEHEYEEIEIVTKLSDHLKLLQLGLSKILQLTELDVFGFAKKINFLQKNAALLIQNISSFLNILSSNHDEHFEMYSALIKQTANIQQVFISLKYELCELLDLEKPSNQEILNAAAVLDILENEPIDEFQIILNKLISKYAKPNDKVYKEEQLISSPEEMELNKSLPDSTYGQLNNALTEKTKSLEELKLGDFKSLTNEIIVNILRRLEKKDLLIMRRLTKDFSDVTLNSLPPLTQLKILYFDKNKNDLLEPPKITPATWSLFADATTKLKYNASNGSEKDLSSFLEGIVANRVTIADIRYFLIAALQNTKNENAFTQLIHFFSAPLQRYYDTFLFSPENRWLLLTFMKKGLGHTITNHKELYRPALHKNAFTTVQFISLFDEELSKNEVNFQKLLTDLCISGKNNNQLKKTEKYLDTLKFLIKCYYAHYNKLIKLLDGKEISSYNFENSALVFILKHEKNKQELMEHLTYFDIENDRTDKGESILYLLMHYAPSCIENFIQCLSNPKSMINEVKTTTGCAPLHCLHYGDDLTVLAAKCLLENGADPSITDATGATPLHVLAAQEYHFKEKHIFRSKVALLIEYGANINAKDLNGEIPLLKLIKHCKNKDKNDLVGILLSFGADPTITNNRAVDALSLAKEQNDLELYRTLKTTAKKSGKYLARKDLTQENSSLKEENSALKKQIANSETAKAKEKEKLAALEKEIEKLRKSITDTQENSEQSSLTNRPW